MKVEVGGWYIVRHWRWWRRLIEVRAVSAGGVQIIWYRPRAKRWSAPATVTRAWLETRGIRNPGDADTGLLIAAATAPNGGKK